MLSMVATGGRNKNAMRLTIKREVEAIQYDGRTYEIHQMQGLALQQTLRALRRGVLDHIGAHLPICPTGCSCPQLYRVGDQQETLVAGAVSSTSQFIDLAWLMSPISP